MGKIKNAIWYLKNWVGIAIFYLLRVFPIDEKKVVATTFEGKKYGDNPQFIIEKLHEYNDHLEFVWLKDPLINYRIPDWVRTTPFIRKGIGIISYLCTCYELVTAKVWIDTHFVKPYYRKRKNQLFIETWHGGLGIKKLKGDSPSLKRNRRNLTEWATTTKMADVFISQSDHLSNIYHTAFGYNGAIYKCGYPKNDILFSNPSPYKNKVEIHYGLKYGRILLYAPTFRLSFVGQIGLDVYNINFSKLQAILQTKFGCDWTIMVRWHPSWAHKMSKMVYNYGPALNVTNYPDMQELLMAADVVISDYSSCIFDAGLRRIPCFTYATDFEQYKREQGVYYEMEELPFPYAKNNQELMDNIQDFDLGDYLKRWDAFTERMGLHETGYASDDIARKVLDFMNGKKVTWE